MSAAQEAFCSHLCLLVRVCKMRARALTRPLAPAPRTPRKANAHTQTHTLAFFSTRSSAAAAASISRCRCHFPSRCRPSRREARSANFLSGSPAATALPPIPPALSYCFVSLSPQYFFLSRFCFILILAVLFRAWRGPRAKRTATACSLLSRLLPPPRDSGVCMR